MPIHEFAPAKLNLYLHVMGRDQRGYHLLDSLVAFADVGDRLSLAPADDWSLDITGPFSAGLESNRDNLVWRAATALATALGRSERFAITLEKNLPVASGIGGGSADAAAALRALCQSWGIDPANEAVRMVALTLGADVPVCLAGRDCFMGGIGERLDPCPPLPSATLLLVNPGVALPTKDVFAARQGAFDPEGRFDVAPATLGSLAHILQGRGNGLTAAALSLCPVIGDVLSALEQAQGCLVARMLGSGATCYGLFADTETAETAARAIALRYPHWWVQPATIGGSRSHFST